MQHKAPLVLTFSASDPSAGAGLQADCLTVSAMGAHPLTVLTGVTAQNTQGLSWFEPLPASVLEQQLACLLNDVNTPLAVKAGVLGSPDNVQVVGALMDHARLPLVLDPVLATGRGDALSSKAVVQAMKERLFEHTTLLTPNWPEAKKLSGKRTPDNVAHALLDMGCGAVLLKGEHFNDATVINRLYQQDGSVDEFECKRLPGQFHGSGCTLASAIAVGLAQGLGLTDAVQLGLDFTLEALHNALAIGQGQLIPDRMHLMQRLLDASETHRSQA